MSRTLRRDGPAIEVAVVPGLEDLAAGEARERLGSQLAITMPHPGTLILPTTDVVAVELLRTAGVAYLVRQFEVRRPRALLGHEHLPAVVAHVRQVVNLHPGAFFAVTEGRSS